MDPVARLKDTERIALDLIRLKQKTMSLGDEHGHPIDLCLRGMIETRQRLFVKYGIEHWEQAHGFNEALEHQPHSEDNVSEM